MALPERAGEKRRRTPRLAVGVPIRVFATDYKGRDFVEDSVTLTINRHGAKIRLERELVPEQEIRILSSRTGQEAVFRVVGRAGKADAHSTYWGVESTNPAQNLWGINFPPTGPEDQTTVRVMLQCPECRLREVVRLDESLLERIQSAGGILRGCLTCGRTGQWKQVPYEN